MKIIIDARMYGLEHAGIGRYVANLIRELKTQNSKLKTIQIALLIRKKNLEEIKREFGSTFKIIVCDLPHYSFKEQIILPLQLFKLKPDLVHFPHFNAPVFWWGKQVVTIHDLIKHQSRGAATTTRWPLFYWFKYLNYRFLVWLAVKRAARVLVPSKWWKKELVRRYKLVPEKIVVTYEGVGKKFKVPRQRTGRQRSKLKVQNVLKRYNIEKPFIIYTGNLYPHKNVERLVEAVTYLNEPNHLSKALSLVIVCSRNIFYERFKKKVRQMKAERFVSLLGFVPDEESIALYRQAEAFVTPSLMEGFGLSPLEAMACSCPVLASDIPVFREVYGEAGLYFDPLDVEDLAEKIRRVIKSKDLRKRLEAAGLERVKRYSWQKMARETLKIYQEAIGS